MSDFGELCPLFNTGVFNEIVFHKIPMTAVTACGNALLGTLTCASATRPFAWTFGRTVVVTGGFVRVAVKPTNATTVRMMHFATIGAAGTEFATLCCDITVSGMEAGYTWVPFSSVTEKTFTSDEILGLGVAVGTASGAGTYDFIVRYKDK
jgi:hypothetical protein